MTTSPLHRTRSALKLDVPRLLQDLGGGSYVRRKLGLLGFDAAPTAVQMHKWVTRRRIPCEWLLALLVNAKDEGRAIDVTAYVLPE